MPPTQTVHVITSDGSINVLPRTVLEKSDYFRDQLSAYEYDSKDLGLRVDTLNVETLRQFYQWATTEPAIYEEVAALHLRYPEYFSLYRFANIYEVKQLRNVITKVMVEKLQWHPEYHDREKRPSQAEIELLCRTIPVGSPPWLLYMDFMIGDQVSSIMGLHSCWFVEKDLELPPRYAMSCLQRLSISQPRAQLARAGDVVRFDFQQYMETAIMDIGECARQQHLWQGLLNHCEKEKASRPPGIEDSSGTFKVPDLPKRDKGKGRAP